MLQYPHFIHTVDKCDAYQDDFGRWIQDRTEKMRYVGRCRYEADGRGSKLTLNDGTHVTISGVIYMRVVDERSLAGCEIVVTSDKEGKDIVCRKTVLSGSSSRLNTRIYV